MGKIVAIVGRPNVGKSTLFNRLTETREAIIHETAGVTRDRHYGKSNWNGKEFSVIDTGGYIMGSDDKFEEEIRKQVALAIEEADTIIFLVDVKDGLTPMDEDVAQMLRRSEKKVLLVANKVDNTKRAYDDAEFYSLGLGDIFSISSINGSGTGDMLDELVKDFEIEEEENIELGLPKITVVGRPNVGKSSLINALIGQERNIVTNVSGTTRDSVNTRYNLFGFDFMIIDTAGVRKKGKVSEDIEFYSVMRSIRSIEDSDICILMLDASEGLESQDLNLYSLIQRNHKGLVVVVNKWDLIEKDTNTSKDFEAKIRRKIAPFDDVPIIFTSVTNKQRIFKVLETAKKVYENRIQRIPTSKLNELILPIVKEQNPPPAYKGKVIKIKYIMQLKTAYPQFVFYCNLPQYIREPYKRYVENRMREIYDFNGVPITLYFREK
ncbi:MAG: ribosome biogenesis GTPase Der [Bacteroidales bacterium]|jgi:GTP-binding protein|nr:ribosome biogenesis GTPase Der [Bacteroidales bacterium]MDD4001628.1 ribosome biogenesis GTPase Der [Bacteroidales bacterium]MDD4528875.1 ribosome biogenesis GTPase Der [Bacteroidales bacterium]MDD4829797.1 ribosome biogenesis GTPase Der [Bacteroidales bacterium]